MVGLSNVDNTTDLLKPISSATQQALDLKGNKPQVEARITFGTTPSILSSTGIQTPTVQNLSTGQYTFTFPTPVANNSYGVLLTARSTTPYFMTYGSVATTGFLIQRLYDRRSSNYTSSQFQTIRTTI
jgi:glycerol kinase